MDILHEESWDQGIRLAVKLYSRASDAQVQNLVAPSVAFWALAIAAGIVLLEWLVSRHRED